MSKCVFRCLLVLTLLAVLTPGAALATTCTYYTNSQPLHTSTYDYCGGSSPFGCTECYTWTSYSSVGSCVMSGEGNCFGQEFQN